MPSAGAIFNISDADENSAHSILSRGGLFLVSCFLFDCAESFAKSSPLRSCSDVCELFMCTGQKIVMNRKL